MPFIKEPNAEPIPGYKLVEKIGSGGFGEVWKCTAPGGIFKAIKFVYNEVRNIDGDTPRADEELRAIERIKLIRHPFLLSMDRVELHDGELMIVTELADQNLYDLFVAHQQNGQRGIPRSELIRYLYEVAEILDMMNMECGLLHLDIKPRNIFLVRNHVKVADFGLVNQLTCDKNSISSIELGAITPLYAAPEVFHGNISTQSDQYSLAVSVCELLTGTLPFNGSNARQLLLQHTQQTPNLESLDHQDQGIMLRALSKSPEDRYASCTAFVEALDGNRSVPEVHVAPSHHSTSETVRKPQLNDTDVSPASAFHPDFIPGYQFVESLRKSPLMEAWRVHDKDGRERQVKLVYGFDYDKKERTRILHRLQSLESPGVAA